MKYTGTIPGMQSCYGSIYRITVDDTKCYLWKTSIVAEFAGKLLNIRFNWNGDLYEMILKTIKENYFTGEVLYNKESCGSSYFQIYKTDDEIRMKENYVEEEDEGQFNYFPELKPDNNNQ